MPILYGIGILSLAGLIFPSFGFFPPFSHEFSLKYFTQISQYPNLTASLFYSLKVGFISFWASLFCAIALCRYQSRILQYLWYIVIIMPVAGLSLGFLFLIAPKGFIARLIGLDWDYYGYSVPDFWGLSHILVLMLKEIPFLTLIFHQASTDKKIKNEIEQAIIIGQSAKHAFHDIAIAQIIHKCFWGLAISMVYALNSLDANLVAGATNPPNLSGLLLQILNNDNNYVLGACLSIIILLINALFIVINLKIIKILMKNWFRFYFIMPIFSIIAHGIIGIIMLSLGILILWSISDGWFAPSVLPENYTFNSIMNAMGNNWQAMSNSILLAMIASILAILIVLWFIFNNPKPKLWQLCLIYYPLIMPDAVFAWGLLKFSAFSPDYLNIFIIFLSFAMAYSYLLTLGHFQRLNQETLDNAKIIGANRWQVFWHIIVPSLENILFWNIAIIAVICCSLYAPIYIINGGITPIFALEIISSINSASRQESAAAILGFIIIGIAVLICLKLIILSLKFYQPRHAP